MSDSTPIRVLIVDDHAAVREGLSAILNRQACMASAGEASDGEAAVHAYENIRPDVVLMDLRMPGLSGVEAILGIMKMDADARIIVLTTFDGDEDIYRAIQSGARGYLLKGMETEEYVEAIVSVHAGKRWIPPAIASRLANRMNRHGLTVRESDVIHLVVRGKSSKEIAGLLCLSEATVKCHLQSLFLKLDVSDRTQAAIEALRQGIVQLDGPATHRD